MSMHSRAKIFAGAEASLRGKVQERERKMQRMERKFHINLQRERSRSARALGKMQAKSAADLQAAEFMAQADVNFWRKRALFLERNADRGAADLKRLQAEMTKVDEVNKKVDEVKDRLASEQQQKRDLTKKMKQQKRLLNSTRASLEDAAATIDDLLESVDEA